MLAAVAPATLARLRFPLGELTKPQVRALAADAGLPVASKPESQDLCFLAGTGKAAFLARHGDMTERPGDLVDRAGRVLGRHRGHHRYTVGQRRGLGVAAAEPLYVLANDAALEPRHGRPARRSSRRARSRSAARACTAPARRSTPCGSATARAPFACRVAGDLGPGAAPPARARARRPGRRRRPRPDRVPAARRRRRRLRHDQRVASVDCGPDHGEPTSPIVTHSP